MDTLPNPPILESLPIPNSPRESRQWSESDRAYTLAVYAESNSSRETERITGVPHNTIQEWARSEWGSGVIQQIRTAIRAKCAWTMIEAAERSANALLYRLKHGDEVVLANGMVVMRAVSARDCIMISSIAQDKVAMLTGMLEGSKQVDRALDALASRLMEQMGKPKANEPPTKAIPAVKNPDEFMG